EVGLLVRRTRRGKEADAARAPLFHRVAQLSSCSLERSLPAGLAPLTLDAQHGRAQAVERIDPLVRKAVAVRNPGLVDLLVLARHDAHEAAAQYVAPEVRSRAVVRRDERVLGHLPGARTVPKRLGIERSDRAQVDDVAGQLVVHAILDPGADLHPFAAPGRTELLQAGDFGGEPHAARAVDAARHVG